MSILVKKIYFDLFNLSNELKNKNDVIKEYQNIFNDYILLYKEQNKSFATIYNQIEQFNEIILTDYNNTSLNNKEYKSELLLKLYRNIVKLTHPDKTKNLPVNIQEQYIIYYRNATLYYNDNNLYELMYINKMLNYNPFILTYTTTDIEQLKKYKDILINKIKDIETSFIWNFMHIDNETELNNFINQHFKSLLNANKI